MRDISTKMLEDLFEQQKRDGAILTDYLFHQKKSAEILRKYYPDLSGGSESKPATIEFQTFNILYRTSRLLRHKQELLYDLGITRRDAAKYYEYDPSDESPYIEYITEDQYQALPGEIQKQTIRAPFYNYRELNPKGKMLPTELMGKHATRQFNVLANYAPFVDHHFLVVAAHDENRGLKQTYHPDTLWWLDDLFGKLNDPAYSLWLSPKGCGNSVDSLHYQLLKIAFPAFTRLGQAFPHTPDLYLVDKNVWPFSGLLARYDASTRDAILEDLHARITTYLKADSENTFNLLAHIHENGKPGVFLRIPQEGLRQHPRNQKFLRRTGGGGQYRGGTKSGLRRLPPHD